MLTFWWVILEIEKSLLKFTLKMYILFLDIHDPIHLHKLWNTKELKYLHH